MFIITRTAKRNNAIAGRTLYLTDIGLWSLDKNVAWRFSDQSEVQKQIRGDAELRIEAVE